MVPWVRPCRPRKFLFVNQFRNDLCREVHDVFLDSYDDRVDWHFLTARDYFTVGLLREF